MNGSKAKRRAAKRTQHPLGDTARTGARTFSASTLQADALNSPVAQAAAYAARNRGVLVQTQARTIVREKLQAFANGNPGSPAVRSIPGVNVSPTAIGNRVDLVKPQLPFPQLVIQRSLPSPFLQGR